MLEDGTDILKKFDKMLTRDANVRQRHQDVRDYILPENTHITSDTIVSTGELRDDKRLDTTATNAVRNLASLMQSSITNKTSVWFNLQIRQKELLSDPEVPKYLKDFTNDILQELDDSNFYTQSVNYYEHLGAYGEAAQFQSLKTKVVGTGFPGFNFKTLAPGSFVFDVDNEGKADTLMYRFRWTAKQIEAEFGPDDLPEIIQKSLDNVDGKNFEIIHAVMPRKGSKQRTPFRRNIFALDMAWASFFILREGGLIIQEGGFRSFPFFVTRWSTNGDEVNGRGPGDDMMPTIKILNRLYELELSAAGLAALPPILRLNEGVADDSDITPGSTIDIEKENAIKYLENKSNLAFIQLESEKLRQQIKNGFMIDAFLELLTGRGAKTPVTATEIEEKARTANDATGPSFGRVESEWLNPFIEYSFLLMWVHRAGPETPQALRGVQAKIDIRYEGLLARQQRNQELVNIHRMEEEIIRAAELDPTAKDWFNAETVVKRTAEILGTSEFIKSEEIVLALQQARGEMAQKAEMLEQETMATQVLAQVAPLLKQFQEQQGNVQGAA